MSELIVVGGGLAGSEAAWQAAQRGIQVNLFEMRPNIQTGAHLTGGLSELICSNSLGSILTDRASGLLKEELRSMESLLLDCAEKTSLPAGGALAVDRTAFSSMVTDRIAQHPNIHIFREEITDIPDVPTIIASGPLTSPCLSNSIQNFTGCDNLFFFDAIAPIVSYESINMDIAYRASRYDERSEQLEGDYLNCPLNQEEYEKFVQALSTAERIQLHEFETQVNEGVRAGKSSFFEGCLPVEIIARRGLHSLAFGPMRPVGLRNPRTGRWPYAAVQLRQDDLAGSLYNLVGFQTNLTYPEQERVFRMIPGLENAEFVRLGQMHRNTFILSPELLKPTLQTKAREDLFFAGQVTGVEGYMGNIGTGLLAGINAARVLNGVSPVEVPPSTMLGSLCRYITQARAQDFQPMKANFKILPELDKRPRGRRDRAKVHAARALADIETFVKGEL